MSIVPGLEVVSLDSKSKMQVPVDLEQGEPEPKDPEPDPIREALVNVGAEIPASTGNNAPVAEVTEPTTPPQPQVDEVLEALMAAIAPAHTATKHMKVFIYGQNGCGKTVLAAQAPGPLLADCDKEGAMSLINHPSLRNTPTLPVRSIFAVEKLLGYLKAGEPRFDFCETLILDPFDDLVYRALSEQVRGNSTVGLNNAERMNQFLAEGYDYNVVTERFHQMMDEIKALDRHVILTAHVQEREDKSTGRTLIRSNITPKLATIIGGAVSLVGYMQYDLDTGRRTLQTAPSNTVTAKTRLHLPGIMENPSFNAILEAFNKLKETESN